MKQVRLGVFETNSSSTHSITLCNADSFEKWCNSNLYWTGNVVNGDLELITEQEMFDKVREEYKDEVWFRDTEYDLYDLALAEGYHTSKTWRNEYLEFFKDMFTTSSGDTVVAFGQYGYA